MTIHLASLAIGTWGIITAATAPFAALLVSWLLSTVINWWRWRDPLVVKYVIPQKDYREVLFEGAPPNQELRESLTVGLGSYRVLHLVEPKRSMMTAPIVLGFDGPSQHKPRSLGVDNPFIVDEVLGHRAQREVEQLKNWHGEVYPIIEGWPRQFAANEEWFFGNRVETTGVWDGTMVLTFRIHGVGLRRKSLNFRVSDKADDIPFLEGERGKDGKHKERKAREAANPEVI